MRARDLFHISVATLALSVGFAGPALAQDAPDETRAGSDAPPPIIVTAQRREENLQDVPIAATALSGDQLSSDSPPSSNVIRAPEPSTPTPFSRPSSPPAPCPSAATGQPGHSIRLPSALKC